MAYRNFHGIKYAISSFVLLEMEWVLEEEKKMLSLRLRFQFGKYLDQEKDIVRGHCLSSQKKGLE